MRPSTTERTRGVASVVLVGVVAAVVALWLVRRGGDGAAEPADVGQVEQVLDGDTIDVAIGGDVERVRLIGIDTPEVAHAAGEVDECYGPEATAFTAGQLPAGTAVRLVRDVVARDDYGRLLAYVFRRTDGVFVNEAIVAGGYARPLTIAPNDAYADRFVAAARAADAAGLGLWSACAG